jgi:hypothetical protein
MGAISSCIDSLQYVKNIDNRVDNDQNQDLLDLTTPAYDI